MSDPVALNEKGLLLGQILSYVGEREEFMDEWPLPYINEYHSEYDEYEDEDEDYEFYLDTLDNDEVIG